MPLERDLSFGGSGIEYVYGDLTLTDPQRVNVLIVDDNENCLMALKEVLAGPDRHLVMVQSGEQALRYLLTADVGVVLLDIRLSGLSGYETAALIRQRNQTRSVPIIFVTGCSKEHSDVARGYSFGAVDYIFKPVDPNVLKSKVDCFVELAKSHQRLKQQTRALAIGEKECLRSQAAATLVQNTPVPAFIAGVDGMVLQLNSAAHELVGLQLDQGAGSSDSSALTPGEKWLVSGAIREAAERGVGREISIHPCTVTGGRMALLLHVAPLRSDDGRVIGVIGIGQDRQCHEQAMLDLERTKIELEGRRHEVEHLKEIVVARDMILLRLQKENESLKRSLRQATLNATASDAAEVETNEADF
jgi:PAS domain S-box-containing protein